MIKKIFLVVLILTLSGIMAWHFGAFKFLEEDKSQNNTISANTSSNTSTNPSYSTKTVEFKFYTRSEYANAFGTMAPPVDAFYGICPYCKSLAGYQATTCASCGKDFQWTIQKVDCFGCDGMNGANCSVCMNPYLAGTRPGKCVKCLNGKCSSCDGTGKWSRNRTCLVCNGTGKCQTCNGTGKCQKCNGTAKELCQICGGKGTLTAGTTPYVEGGYTRL